MRNLIGWFYVFALWTNGLFWYKVFNSPWIKELLLRLKGHKVARASEQNIVNQALQKLAQRYMERELLNEEMKE